MITTITEEQATKLHLAIDRAEGFGGCRYVVPDSREPLYGADGSPTPPEGARPCCVIAQLAAIEGHDVDTLWKWWNVGVLGVLGFAPYRGYGYDGFSPVSEDDPLLSYPAQLLSRLQSIWDFNANNPDLPSTEKARQEMHEVVRVWLRWQ